MLTTVARSSLALNSRRVAGARKGVGGHAACAGPRALLTTAHGARTSEGVGVRGAGGAPHSIVSCARVNSGRQFVLQFADQTRYQLHTAWLKDASPSNVGADFYRTSAQDVARLHRFRIAEAAPEEGGEQLAVHFEESATDGARSRREVFCAKWLHSFAPFVGKPLDAEASKRSSTVEGTGAILDHLRRQRKPFFHDLQLPQFDATLLESDLDTQAAFIEAMEVTGVAMIAGVAPPKSLEREVVGMPMEDVVFNAIGKTNQHPRRSTRYGVMRKTAESARQGADYDMANPLSMHTDHSVYEGTPGYYQFLYQAEGSVRSKVCDGLALTSYFRDHHPGWYELLTKVDITHSSRNELYTKDGAPRDVNDGSSRGSPFELVHTHPIIQLGRDGLLEKVVQSETKRGACALPYDVYEPFMEAYKTWNQLCEDPRFIHHFDWPEGCIVATNNWRTLHGRASVPPGMARTMCFSYVNKTLVENRYRLLKQSQVERDNPVLSTPWLTRVPNQVLERMTFDAA